MVFSALIAIIICITARVVELLDMAISRSLPESTEIEPEQVGGADPEWI